MSESVREWITSGSWQLGDNEKKRLAACLELAKGTTICDIGARDGTLSLTLAREHPEMKVVAVDISEEIDWSNMKAAQLGLDNFVGLKMDILDAPSLGSFSTIYLCEVLEHLDPNIVQRAYDTVLGMLKEDGRLVVSVPSNSHISDNDHRTVFYREQFHNHVRYFRYIDGMPHLWIGFYVDKENPEWLLEEETT